MCDFVKNDLLIICHLFFAGLCHEKQYSLSVNTNLILRVEREVRFLMDSAIEWPPSSSIALSLEQNSISANCHK